MKFALFVYIVWVLVPCCCCMSVYLSVFVLFSTDLFWLASDCPSGCVLCCVPVVCTFCVVRHLYHCVGWVVWRVIYLSVARHTAAVFARAGGIERILIVA